MKAYSEYKAMNLPWLKAIPAHWEIRRNKNVFTEMKEEVGEHSSEYTLLSLTLNGIIPRDMDAGGKFPSDFGKYKVVKKGYMAFCLFDVDETPRTVGLSNFDGMLTGAYTIMNVSNINPRYILYYYLELDNGKLLKPLYTGLRKTINGNTFQSTKIPVPPRTEQDQIVRFLDWKISMVNRLINTKRREIKAVDAMKRSMVSSAVTRGIEPNAPMKFSGTKLLGDIPEHWETAPLVSMAKEKSICDCTELQLLSVYLDEGVIPFAQKDEKRTNTTSKDLSKYQRVDPGDFVLNNQQAWRGSVGVSFDTGIVSPAYIVLQMDDTLNREYANYLLRSRGMVDQYLVISRGVGSIQRNIYWSSLKRVIVPIPPKEEQERIVAYLKETVIKMQNAILYLTKEVETLEEYKTKLIADVVTGKIDVRDVEIPEYEFVDEDADADSDSDDDSDDTEEQEG